jgi:hypothetical protein
VISVEIDISESYAKTRAGDRAGLFVIKGARFPCDAISEAPKGKATGLGAASMPGWTRKRAVPAFGSLFLSLFPSVNFGKIADLTRLFAIFCEGAPFTGIYRGRAR